MRKYAVIHKKIGETPLQSLESFRRTDPTLLKVPLSYAGRLDPMAQGQLVVLIGDECKRRDRYDRLDKTYVFEVLLGFSTDSGDVLGMPQEGKQVSVTDRTARDVATSLVGIHTLPYPAFSSKTVNGKPLFHYALENKLAMIEIPTADIRIYSLRYIDRLILPKDKLIGCILDKIEHLRANYDSEQLGSDFRKEAITKQWWSLQDRRKAPCTILRFEATVSAGTYIRTLAPLIAERLGTIGLAYSIHRTRVGRFQPIIGSKGIWLKKL